jgi:tRNA dimethylallyltransferase
VKGKFLIVIVGPTAVGKTSLAIQLAMQFQTSVVSADARQIFKELEIGTAKPSLVELQEVRHHLINTHSIHDDFNAGTFAALSEQVINELFQAHDYVILCGGSGLYIKALLSGFDNIPEVPKEIREEIIQSFQQNGLEWLQNEVMDVDKEFYRTTDISNPQRLMRALEVFRAVGEPISTFKSTPKKELPYGVIKIGLNVDREELYQRIDKRMDDMIAIGLFDEAKGLYQHKNLNALQTVGYSEIFGFMDGDYDKAEAIRLLKRNSRRYAKRQLTWFNSDKEITWFRPDDYDSILKFIKEKSTIL